MHHLVLWLITVTAALAAPGDRHGDLNKDEGPIEFRCDAGQGFTNPNRWICRDNVIVRRGSLLLCCTVFEGYTGADGGWNRFTCTGDVRARRGDETMWAQKATFILEDNDLILTGNPTLMRGRSLLEGERIVVDTKYDRAHILNPRGRLHPASAQMKTPKPSPVTGPLPKKCPVRAAP